MTSRKKIVVVKIVMLDKTVSFISILRIDNHNFS